MQWKTSLTFPRNIDTCASSVYKKEKIEKRAKANTFSQPSSYRVHRLQKNLNAFLQWSTSMCFLISHLSPGPEDPRRTKHLCSGCVHAYLCTHRREHRQAAWEGVRLQWELCKCLLDIHVTQLPQEQQLKGAALQYCNLHGNNILNNILTPIPAGQTLLIPLCFSLSWKCSWSMHWKLLTIF